MTGKFRAITVVSTLSVTLWVSGNDSQPPEVFRSISATGAECRRDGQYLIYTFLSNGTFRAGSTGTADVLLVGGGGGGGAFGGGGGGGGWVIHKQNVVFTNGVYAVTVGRGGAGATRKDSTGQSGGASTLESVDGLLNAIGGGGGGSISTPGGGGAGGGAGCDNYVTMIKEPKIKNGAASFYSGGFGGGKSFTYGDATVSSFHWYAVAGGGGGATAAGGDGYFNSKSDCMPGCGGAGYSCAITGSEAVYGSGGGGGNGLPDAGYAGKGGSGAGDGGGNRSSKPQNGCDGVAGFGGGGGGGGRYVTDFANGGAGGDGVVIIRCKIALAERFESVHAEGAETLFDDDCMVSTFSSDGTLTFVGNSVVDVLLVGGGGGGSTGQAGGGGGGAGGFVYRESYVVPAGVYEVKVGLGGQGAKGGPISQAIVAATSGGPSSVFSLLAHGGGQGGGNAQAGSSGGSGGGGGGYYITNASKSQAGGACVSGEGFAGGKSVNATSTDSTAMYHLHSWAGGGGGAGAKGGDGVLTGAYISGGTHPAGLAGKGGDGLPCSITGSEVWYAGGGGGGFADYSQPAKAGTVAGGKGGGGGGSGSKTSTAAFSGTNGEDGFGGGGGGGGGFALQDTGDGGNGGNGVVIVRYRTPADSLPSEKFEKVEVVGAKRTRDGEYSVYTFSQNGTFTVKGASKAEVLVVGGGGGGGTFAGGGGGGGWVERRQNVVFVDGTYEVTVGQGGLGATDWRYSGSNGDTSSLESSSGLIRAFGGGGGGSLSAAKSGGSGGGAGADNYVTAIKVSSVKNGAVSSVSGGFGGGKSFTYGDEDWHYHWYAVGGGGGGAVENGKDAYYVSQQDCRPGDGGAGLSCSISGEAVVYGSGGGGGNGLCEQRRVGKGGDGAGDGGGNYAALSQTGLDGVDGRGGGGGGGGRYVTDCAAGGKGGDGVVIIRCKVQPKGLVLQVR